MELPPIPGFPLQVRRRRAVRFEGARVAQRDDQRGGLEGARDPQERIDGVKISRCGGPRRQRKVHCAAGGRWAASFMRVAAKVGQVQVRVDVDRGIQHARDRARAGSELVRVCRTVYNTLFSVEEFLPELLVQLVALRRQREDQLSLCQVLGQWIDDRVCPQRRNHVLFRGNVG